MTGVTGGQCPRYGLYKQLAALGPLSSPTKRALDYIRCSGSEPKTLAFGEETMPAGIRMPRLLAWNQASQLSDLSTRHSR